MPSHMCTEGAIVSCKSQVTILYVRSVVRWLWWFYEWLPIYTFYNVRVPRQWVTIINMHPVHPPTHLALKIKTNTGFSCRWVQQKVQSPISLTKSRDLKCHARVNADVSKWLVGRRTISKKRSRSEYGNKLTTLNPSALNLSHRAFWLAMTDMHSRTEYQAGTTHENRRQRAPLYTHTRSC